MSKIFFSVIIPTFNRLEKLKFAINSVLSQTISNYEIIIIDNHSTDGTVEYLKNLNRKIKFFSIKNNGCIAKSRNLGVKRSKGLYIAFLDSDDFWFPNKLSEIMKLIKKNYDFIYHDMFYIGKYKILKKLTGYTRQIDNKNSYDDLLKNGPAFPTSSVVIKKKLLEKVNYMSEKKTVITWEDYDAWLRIAKLKCRFKCANQTLGYLSLSLDSLSNNNRQIFNIRRFKKKYSPNYYPEWCKIRLAILYFKSKNFIKSVKFIDTCDFKKLNFKDYLIINIINILCRIIIFLKK